ncbi:UDP-N-acetyl-D-mannosamine dehydrogenase [Candidatus Megaera polyxenophila]|nr:UDP-N-acetyl-D-mannosamine dehydrogenase [Candidatus Megaera polyxenophila]
MIGGIDKESTLRAVEFYKTFSSGKISLTDAKTAEAIKLAENTYRDINIAYANELSIIADILNIDISLLIKLANEHPRVNILEPGIGVGGHCIAVDPHFLIFSAPNESSLITTARKVNDTKSNWIIKKIIVD